jgi:cytoskeletal protein RodZ
MARPDCPRCGSDLVVTALPGSPSEWVEELRGGSVRARAVVGGVVHWLCRACGNRWDPDADPDRWFLEASRPLPDPGDVLADVGVELDPREQLETSEPIDMHPGALLRRAREERGTTLADVAHGTRIPEHHLRALESDASLEAFPAPPYARFFLREYAEFLQLEPVPLLQEFEARHPLVEEPPLQPIPAAGDRKGVIGTALALVAVAALILIALLQPTPRQAEPINTSGAAVEVHDSGRVLTSPPTPTAERRGVRAVLHVSQPCWVSAVADGEVVASVTLVPGEPVVYRARRDLQLTLGNAGGVELRVNGDPVATGSPGDVVVLGVSWQRGEVSIARG